MPFLNKTAWLNAQHSSSPLRRVYAHLPHGRRPSRKAKHVRDVKRYLAISSIDNSGLIIVRKSDPFVHHRDLIVVPEEILPGLLTAIHIQFCHATKHQLAKLFDRHFYAISSSKAIETVVESCQQCSSLKQLNKELFEQSSSTSPSKPGENFATDVIQRATQNILVTRDIHTSYTTALIIPDQTAPTLRSALLRSTSLIRLPTSSIRIDNAPGFLPLKNDPELLSYGISLDLGRVKNINKNPVAEKSNQELQLELLRLDSSGAAVSETTLQQAVKNLNTRIRNRGLSAQELLFCRDQTTGEQLTFKDSVLSDQQQEVRKQNHPHSASSKAKGAPPAVNADVTVGDLVFIKSEGNKNKSRDVYVIVKIVDELATLQKLNGSKFLSKQYEVPLTNVFTALKPCEPNKTHTNLGPTDTGDTSSSSSDEEEEEDQHPPTAATTVNPPAAATTVNPPANTEALQPRRSGRTRNPPSWMTSGEWQR